MFCRKKKEVKQELQEFDYLKEVGVEFDDLWNSKEWIMSCEVVSCDLNQPNYRGCAYFLRCGKGRYFLIKKKEGVREAILYVWFDGDVEPLSRAGVVVDSLYEKIRCKLGDFDFIANERDTKREKKYRNSGDLRSPAVTIDKKGHKKVLGKDFV
jgi:hypothetical protein